MKHEDWKRIVFHTSIVLLYIGLFEFLYFNKQEDEQVRALCIIGLILFIVSLLAHAFLFAIDIGEEIIKTKRNKSVRVILPEGGNGGIDPTYKHKAVKTYDIFNRDFQLYGNYDVSLIRKLKGDYVQFIENTKLEFAINARYSLVMEEISDTLVYVYGSNGNRNYFIFNIGYRICNIDQFRDAVERTGNGIVIALGVEQCIAASIEDGLIQDIESFQIDNTFLSWFTKIIPLENKEVLKYTNATITCTDQMAKSEDDQATLVEVLAAVKSIVADSENDCDGHY